MEPFRTRCSRNLALALGLAAIAGASAFAQTRAYPSIGRVATGEEIRKWDIAIGPAGKELPAGSGSVPQGAFLYFTKRCIVCHGAALEGTQYGPQLAGGQGTLATAAPVRTVGSYWPLATTVWDYINRAMPRSPYQEGSLTPDEVYSLTAFLLYKNEIISAADTLDAVSLPRVRMPNRDGFVPRRPDLSWYRKVCRTGSCRPQP